jgi:thiol-disulfide isomerase/thioredoxin
MARINGGAITRNIEVNGIKYKIRNTEQFENESFGFPKTQDLPTDHYEVKPFQIVGAIASGKSTLAERYYGYRIKQQWRDAVDFFKIEDLYASVDAIKESKKPVHYCVLDDLVAKLDSRNPMGNIDVTQMYYEIRHEFQKHAKRSGGNAGGLVLMALCTQDYMAIDKRLRNSVMFTVFKTYDPYCDKVIDDPEVIQLLKELKDKSVRVCDYNFRKLAVGVDTMNKYTLFYADRDILPKIDYRMVLGESIYEKQRDVMINYLIDNFLIADTPKDTLKAELFFEIDRIEESGERSRVKKSDFTEIIRRAGRIQEIQMEPILAEQQREKERKKRQKEKKEKALFEQQFNHLINHLKESFILEDLTKDDMKAELLFEIDRIEESGQKCYIEESNFHELIIRAKRKQKKVLEKERKKQKENQRNDRTNISEVVLHDVLGKTFRDIAELKGISPSTAHDRYTKQKEQQKRVLLAIESGELSIESS